MYTHLGAGAPFAIPPSDYGTEPNLTKTLPTALATMWPIVWVAGSPDILSLTRPPSPSLTHQHQVAAAADTPSALLKDSSQYLLSFTLPLGLFLPLPPYPYPCPHGIPFWNTIPQVYSSKATYKPSLDTVAFSQLLSPAGPILYLGSQARPGHSLCHVIPLLLSPLC